MDVFSAGCVLLELFVEGGPVFDLPALLRYRRGLPEELDAYVAKLAASLPADELPDARRLLCDMTARDARGRPKAAECLPARPRVRALPGGVLHVRVRLLLVPVPPRPRPPSRATLRQLRVTPPRARPARRKGSAAVERRRRRRRRGGGGARGVYLRRSRRAGATKRAAALAVAAAAAAAAPPPAATALAAAPAAAPTAAPGGRLRARGDVAVLRGAQRASPSRKLRSSTCC